MGLSKLSQNQDKKQKIKLRTKSENVARFMPMLEVLAAKDELNEVMKSRVEKAVGILDEGVSLFPNTFRKDTDIQSILSKYENVDNEELEKSEDKFSIAGRIISLRSFGKVTFLHLLDRTAQLQVFVQKSELGDDAYKVFRKFDIGDIVGVKGDLFRTKTGELTLTAESIELLTKSMRPLPEKWHGLKDVETRYRQRYVDLIVNERAREIFKARTAIVSEIRKFLDERGFLEVETPTLQSIPGGATAKPFETHHNALDMQLFMRIAPELYLKRLLVGGFEKVYEIGRNFRNEGISTQHNPEFTMCEFYWAYADFHDLMDLTEELFAACARRVTGGTVVPYQEYGDIDLTPGKWHRYTFHESLEVIGGLKADFYNDFKAVEKHVKERGEKVYDGDRLGKIQAKLFDMYVEPKLVQPTFIYEYPTDISPLSRRKEGNPEVTDRFELFMTGREMANAFSELNDPIDQLGRFLAQVAEKEAGDEEAHYMDMDYVRALEYGMPPAAGQGVGIDRLVMLLTNSASIREVILFPLLRSEG